MWGVVVRESPQLIQRLGPPLFKIIDVVVEDVDVEELGDLRRIGKTRPFFAHWNGKSETHPVSYPADEYDVAGSL